VCVNSVQQNIKCGIKWDKYFVDEVETQLREKPLRGNQTQDIHYSEDKARYKTVTLTYTQSNGRTLISNV
jgi:cytochrome oxidase assembly protein ShyY1